jgi:hypothetical protein
MEISVILTIIIAVMIATTVGSAYWFNEQNHD